ncbi:MOSC domain-containing protein [Haloquadratum walsbyi]|uniref:MOSC domain protein n=2 Tax=Haloquadratum walsbyi TaxID=293091 RepID=Q18I05_HALWD|nr:MOSC N-terminal beta barrel domain-containing protein [Haloquadratum walsbyi]CAJ52373.1 MOSC domain protein [Haloquadratum walsbyi DSM 16790]
MPTLSQILTYPVKALDPSTRDRVSITNIGGLSGDRAYAMKDADGKYIHGKRTPAVHRLHTTCDLDSQWFKIRVHGTDQTYEFQLDTDREALESWLSEYFGLNVILAVELGGGQTDNVIFTTDGKAGPTVISEATIHEVASWYDGICPEQMQQRLRPNLVVSDVPPFWEDRLITDSDYRLQIGDVRLTGAEPIPRCIVPARHPHTGMEYDGFRETFVQKRAETLRAWVDPDDLDENLFSLMIGTEIPESERDGELAVGETVQIVSR